MEAFIETKKLELESAAWSDCEHHKAADFLVYVFPNSTLALSKFYSRRTSYETVAFIILPWHSNVMTEKYLIFLINMLRNVSPQAVRKKECTSSW